MKKVKTPSKFTALQTLKDIQVDYCIGKTGQEYQAEELQELIWEKESKNDMDEAERLIKERENEC